MVTTACAIRLSNSSVSIRSEFQISERSLTLDAASAVEHFVDQLRPSSSTSPVRNTAQLFCITRCIRARSCAVGVPPRRGGNCRDATARARRSPRQLGLLVVRREQFRRSAAPRRGRTPRDRSASWSRGGWRRAPRRSRPRRAPSGQARRVGIADLLRQRPRRDNSWGCRPCCSARSAAPGSARWVTSTPAKMRAVRKCRAAARAGPSDRDGRGAG